MAMSNRYRKDTRSRRPMTAGRRSTIWCSGRCSSAAGAPRSPRPSGSAAASSRSASAPASRCPTTRATAACSASTFRRRCCDKARERVAELGLDHVEGLEVMDAERLNFPDAVVRRRGGAIRRHRGAQSGGGARRVRPRAQARRRDRHPEPGRRRSRAAARGRALVRAGRRAGSAGAPNSPGSATRAGRTRRTACAWSSGAPCRRSGISR